VDSPAETRTGTVTTKVVAALAAVVPPAALGAGFEAEVRSHPVESALVLVGYWLVLGIVGVATDVGRGLKALWVPRLVAAIDQTVTELLRHRLKRYLRQVFAEVRDVELVGVATQGEFVLRLEQVYVDVSLAPTPLQQTPGEPTVGRLKAAPTERRALSSFLSGAERQVLAVIGGPGCGKTTLVRHTAADLCGRSRRRRIPVLLYLRDHIDAVLAESPPDLAEIAVSVAWLSGKVPAEWLRKRLDDGGCVVMLDGLDEVASDEARGSIVAWIERQIQAYPDNDYIVTSRPLGYLARPVSRANVLQVRRFTGEQISSFLHSWYYAVECRAVGAIGEQVRSRSTAKANDLLSRLSQQPALYDLAANPLLLTMIANVHRYRDALPGSRAALYAEMCDVLLYRRQEAKGLIDSGTGLRGEQKELVIRALAIAMMTSQTRDISRKDACRAIREVLGRVSSTVTPKDFLAEVHKSGLMVERESDVLAFAHLTLQEYLAAAYLREQRNPEVLTAAVDDPWWRECTLLWAAGSDASPVILACLDSGTSRALALAFDCLEQAREVGPEVRKGLELVLATWIDDDAARRRLITSVKASRALRDVIRLGEDIAVCAKPVTNEIYSIFLRDQLALGFHPSPHPGMTQAADGDLPAVGMWGSEAARFVDWLNSLFDDGTVFRLPYQDELTDPAMGLVVKPADSVWAQGVEHPHLYWAQETKNPYLCTEELLRRRPFPVESQLNLALGIDHVLDRSYARHFLRTEDIRTGKKDGADSTAIARDLVLSSSLGSDLDSALVRAFERDLDFELKCFLGQQNGPDFEDGFESRMLSRNHYLALEHCIDLNRALSRYDTTAIGVHKIDILAPYILTVMWSPSLSKRYKVDRAPAQFSAFLADIPPKGEIGIVRPEHALNTIEQIRESLAPQQTIDGFMTASSLAELVLREVCDLVAPILAANVPYERETVAIGRIGLLAVMAMVDAMNEKPIVNLAKFAFDIYAVGFDIFCALTAIQERSDGGIVPNEKLVLVRA
jgi:NACHT domain